MTVAAGVSLGLLIGLISGSVFLLLLKTATFWSEKGASLILPLVGQIVAIPSFWGGGWLGGRLLEELLSQGSAKTVLVHYYVVSLAVTFLLIFAYPAYRWILRLGEELGGRPRP